MRDPSRPTPTAANAFNSIFPEIRDFPAKMQEIQRHRQNQASNTSNYSCIRLPSQKTPRSRKGNSADLTIPKGVHQVIGQSRGQRQGDRTLPSTRLLIMARGPAQRKSGKQTPEYPQLGRFNRDDPSPINRSDPRFPDQHTYSNKNGQGMHRGKLKIPTPENKPSLQGFPCTCNTAQENSISPQGISGPKANGGTSSAVTPAREPVWFWELRGWSGGP